MSIRIAKYSVTSPLFPGGIHSQQHTARPPPMLHAASMFRRGNHPQIGQGENHQHDHSPAPNKSHPGQRPALEADRRPRREQQLPRPRSDRPTPARRPAHVAPVPAMGKPPADTAQHAQQPHLDRPQISQPEPPRPRRRASEARHSIRHTAKHFFKSKAQIRHILAISHPLQNRETHDLHRIFNGQS